MRVVPALLGWRDPGSAFSAAMQLAALAAVISYFWRDVRDDHGAVGAGRCATGDSATATCAWRSAWSSPPSRSWWSATCVPGAERLQFAAARPARHRLGLHRHGVLLALAELFARAPAQAGPRLASSIARRRRRRPGGRPDPRRLALGLDPDRGPGLGFKREEAARFSFLLGIPGDRPGRRSRSCSSCTRRTSTATAGRCSPWAWSSASISAFVAIWGLMRILERFSAWPFVDLPRRAGRGDPGRRVHGLAALTLIPLPASRGEVR